MTNAELIGRLTPAQLAAIADNLEVLQTIAERSASVAEFWAEVDRLTHYSRNRRLKLVG